MNGSDVVSRKGGGLAGANQLNVSRRGLSLIGAQWLPFARMAWLIVAAASIYVFVTSAPDHYLWLSALSQPFVADPEAVRAGLARFGLTASFYAGYQVGLSAIFTLVACVTAGVIVMRKAEERMALYVAFMLVIWGATMPLTVDALLPFFSPQAIMLKAFTLTGWMLFFVFFYIFPDGRFVPGWTPWLMVLWFGREVTRFFFPDSPANPFNWPRSIQAAEGIFSALTCISAQIYRYRSVSDVVQRQQTKWVVFGMTVAAIGIIIYAVQTLFLPGRIQAGALFDLVGAAGVGFAALLVPLTLTMAMLSFRLWDVDVLINRALVYSVLTGMLALVYAGCVGVLLLVFRNLTGARNGIALSASTLAIAMLFQPLRAWAQTFIDRRFYRSKYDAARTLAAFGAQLQHEVDLVRLTGDLVHIVEETMQPKNVSLWLRRGDK
jgi:hypothetical protein